MKYLICCPGPSLTQEDVNYGKSKADVTICCNGAATYCRGFDILYSSDPRWFRKINPDPTDFGELLCPFETGGIAELIQAERGRGFNNNLLHLGHSSGFAAVGLALLRGAKEIYLLGYDMGKVNNKAHFFGDYPEVLVKESPYEKFIMDFVVSKDDLELFSATITNCTTGSNLDCFPIVPIREAL